MNKRVSPAGAIIGGVLGFWITVGLMLVTGFVSRLLANGFAIQGDTIDKLVISCGAGTIWGAGLGAIIAKTPHIALWRSVLLGALYGAITGASAFRGGSRPTLVQQVPWMALGAVLGAAVATIVGFMLRPRDAAN